MFNFLSRAPSAPKMSVADALEGQKNGDVIVVDIREHNELVASGKVEGAKHISMMMLQTRFDPRHPECDPDLSTDKTIALYCATGARASGAVRMLAQLGYTDVHNLGGLFHMHSAGANIVAHR